MATQTLNKLAPTILKTQKKPGFFHDGGGLYLKVKPTGAKSWIFRYRDQDTKKLKKIGLGATHEVDLKAARDKAVELRKTVAKGIEPIPVPAAPVQLETRPTGRTFRACARAFIANKKDGWKSLKHQLQWSNTLDTYAYPVIGDKHVQDITDEDVEAVLRPIWKKKHETATRVQGRIENILDWAKVKKYRTGDNPARWKGHMQHLLAKISKKKRVKHFKALPYAEVGPFVRRLREMKCISALALEFTILTVVRTNMTIPAKPEEFDLENAVWTVPAGRMKGTIEHRIPLCARAVEIVRGLMNHPSGYVFPGQGRVRRPSKFKPTHPQPAHLSNMAMLELVRGIRGMGETVHGFRSSFRDWSSETTNYPHEVCEMVLAHTIGDDAEAAYRRGILFPKRRKVMDAWAVYIDKTSKSARVIPLRSAA
jgi:integrase